MNLCLNVDIEENLNILNNKETLVNSRDQHNSRYHRDKERQK